ncbi:MAG: YdcF family protein [Oscillospiraceae bacterium]|nr:YdcF family protein [Oscillospiraceae bacterium]
MTDNHPTYDTIVVLGAQVREDGTPSEALRRRMALALARFGAHPAPIICCGARGVNEPEAEGTFMCRWLAENGVPPEMLLPETDSFDTMQNLRNAQRIMAEKGFSHALVITSDYHLRRSLAICRRFGLSAEGAGSPSLPQYWLKNNLREGLAWGKFVLAKFFKRFRPPE